MKNQKVQRLQSPKKSPKDEKEYSIIQLPNGLTALIVSDVKNLTALDNERTFFEREQPKDFDTVSAGVNQLSLNDLSKRTGCEDNYNSVTEEDSDLANVTGENPNELAGVALTVSVGSFSDPAEIPGLAHFLQHMILLGCDKHPDENYFCEYLDAKGGCNSAFTEDEHTTFYFECPEEHLEEAVGIFSQCFVSPLLKKDAMARGLEAVESKFQSRCSEPPNLQQLFRSLAAPDNPYGKFRCGNRQTLKDNVSGDYLHSSTVEFWKRHYSAHRMNLAIQARLPASLLESWVVKYFSPIPSNNLPPDSFPMAGPPFVKETFQKMHFVQSTMSGTFISIEWILPPMIKYRRERPSEYVSWIMNHDGRNSLIEFLRSKNWASDYFTDVTHNSLFTHLEVRVKLTDSDIDEILAAVFSYLKLVREQGPNERIFDEMTAVAEFDFRFQKKQDAVSYVTHLSQSMLRYPPEDYLCSCAKYDPELILSLLEELTPENACIVIQTDQVFEENVFDKEEIWFKTKYRADSMQPELLEYFKNFELPKSVTLPPPNDFVLSFDSIPSFGGNSQFPVKMDSSDSFEIWHKQHSVEVPTSMMHFHFITDLTNSSARNSALFAVYMQMFKQTIRPAFWPACICGYVLCLEKTDRGFTLELSGYYQKLHLALALVLAQIKNFPADVSSQLFETVKEAVGEEHRNALKGAAEVEACLRFTAVLRNYRFLHLAHIAELPKIQFEDLVEFSKHLWQQLRVHCLFQGNLTATQAKETCDLIKSTLKFDALPLGRTPYVTSYQLPFGTSVCKVRSFNVTDANCFTTEYYQCGVFDLKLSCIIQLFGLIFEERLDMLRVGNQLGYVVTCNCQNINGVLGFWVLLISPLDYLEPQFVVMELSSFVQNFDKELKSLSQEAFKKAQDSLVKSKLRSFDSLQDEVDFNFQEIVLQNFFFSRHHEEARHIRELSLSDLVEWYEKYVTIEAEMLRKLSVQVIGYNPNTEDESSPAEENSVMPVDYVYIEEPELDSDSKTINNIKLFNNSLQAYALS